MLRYKDLTPEQKKHICNGCGSKGGIIKVPNFIFLASCNHHDFLFWIGHTWKDFTQANWKFYKKMLKDVKKVKWYKQPYYFTWATAYMSAVTVGGRRSFHFADKYKTLEDLNMEILSAKTKKMFDALKKDNEELMV